MTIQFEVSVTGDTIGRQLRYDEEECAYAFKALLEDVNDRFVSDLAGYLGHDADQIADALLDLGHKIREAAAR